MDWNLIFSQCEVSPRGEDAGVAHTARVPGASPVVGLHTSSL